MFSCKNIMGARHTVDSHFTDPMVSTFGLNKDNMLWFDLHSHLKVLL